MRAINVTLRAESISFRSGWVAVIHAVATGSDEYENNHGLIWSGSEVHSESQLAIEEAEDHIVDSFARLLNPGVLAQ